MKTHDYLKRILFAISMTLILTHCGSSGSNTSTTAAATGYYVSGGYCYNSAGAVVGLSTSCPTTATSAVSTSGYYVSGNYCYSSTGSVVGLASSCSGLTTTTSTYGATSCVGNYIYTGYGTPTLVQCNGTNCRGATLYTYPGYQQVYCQ